MLRQAPIALVAFVCLVAVQADVQGQSRMEPCSAHTREVRGVSLYYRTCGAGQPVLLLHAFNESGASRWDQFIPRLAGRHQLIVPDMRGHGRSTNPSSTFSHREAASDMFALLDALGIRDVAGIGTSSGGIVLLHMATQQPDRVRALVTVGTATRYPEAARREFRESTVDALTPEQYRVGRERHGTDERVRELRRYLPKIADDVDDVAFTPDMLRRVTAPTLIVHGDRDRTLPLDIPLELYRAIPKAYLWIVPNGGHVPINNRVEEFVTQALQVLGEWK